MNSVLTRIAAPSAALLSISDAKDHCRITDIVEDYLIEGYIAAATAYLDAQSGILGEALVSQTWRVSCDQSPSGALILPLGPVLSVVEIKYVDAAGAVQTFAPANYRLAGNIIELVDGASWPDVGARKVAFWVDYLAG